MPSMFIGGAERSLLGLLEAIDYSRYDVSLFLYRHEGEFLKYIPEKVHILSEMPQYRTFDTPIRSLLFSRQALFGLKRLRAKAAAWLHTKNYRRKARRLDVYAVYCKIFAATAAGHSRRIRFGNYVPWHRGYAYK